MLACEVLHACQAALQRIQRVRVQVEVVADAFQQGEGFVQLDRGRVQQGIDLAEARLVRDFARPRANRVPPSFLSQLYQNYVTASIIVHSDIVMQCQHIISYGLYTDFIHFFSLRSCLLSYFCVIFGLILSADQIYP